MKDINVDITLRDNVTGKYLRIPVIPEIITYQGGDAIVTAVTILQLGTVEFPAGKDLDSVSWAAFLPARYDAAYCKYSDLKTPIEYKDILEGWKTAHTPLQLIIPALDINKTVYVKAFPWEYKGFEGDIYYQLEVRELRTIRPRQINPAAATVARKTTTTPAARAAIPQVKKATSYTVKKGDTLMLIAKQLGIADWRKGLYEPNKKVIGSNPNKIEPGQVLKL
jgi:hypothetical protein